MANLYRIGRLFLLTVFVAACTTPILPPVSIARHPAPADLSPYNVHAEIPRYDPNSRAALQVDLRSSDLTQLDLTKSREDLLYADFDSKTKWPPAEKMPADFDWQKIMETGKNPGLGIQALHRQGLNGSRIGIAMIDTTLLVDHFEYKDRIRVYEETEDAIAERPEAQMHGAAVSAIAVGKTTGIAPEADLYYIATGSCGGAASLEDFDLSCWAKAIQRVVEINKGLPAGRKIRVLSLSFGWASQSRGYDEILAAVNEAKATGMFVISANLGQTYKFYFQGLGRAPLEDPDLFESYAPGLWWKKEFFSGLPSEFWDPAKQMLLVPMDSRTVASPTGVEDYVFYRQGGWSWSIPYLAGMYALAAQVRPEITPEEFWKTALETGQTIRLQHAGEDYEFGVILDPQALIEALQSR